MGGPDSTGNEERESPSPAPGWMRLFQWIFRPLCLHHNDRSINELQAQDLADLEEALATEREQHHSTMIHLHRAQEEVRMLQAEIDELTIERDTLKTALSSIFQANHMVKKEILHVEDSQEINDSPVFMRRAVGSDHSSQISNPPTTLNGIAGTVYADVSTPEAVRILEYSEP